MRLSWSYLVSLFLVAAQLLSVAQAKDFQSETCDVDKLRKLLFTDVPEYSGVAEVLAQLVTRKEFGPSCLKVFEIAESVVPYLQVGERARQEYIGINQKYFGSADANLVLVPDAEIIRRLRFEKSERTSPLRGTKQKTPPEWEIQQRALRETISRFSLPDTLTFSSLSTMRTHDSRYYDAYDFYVRREARLRLTWEKPEVKPPPPSPERFKAAMIERLYALRILNLKAAIREGLQDWRSHTIDIEDLKTGHFRSIPIEELGSMQFQFFTRDSAQAMDSRIHLNLPKEERHWIIDEYLKWKDKADSYYAPPKGDANMRSDEVVQLKDSTGSMYFISSSSFREILKQLNPRMEGEHFGRDSLQHRFRLESIAREDQLSNMIQALRSQVDGTFEELEQRLQTRVNRRYFDPKRASPYLTYEISNAGWAAIEPSTPASIIWQGWAKSPQHWLVRDKTATDLSLPNYSETKDLTSGQRSSVKRANKNIMARYQSESDRVNTFKTAVYKKVRNLLLMAGAALVYSQADLSTAWEFISQQIPQMITDGGSSAKRWDFAGRMDAGRDNSGMSMDIDLEANNNDIDLGDQAGNGEGKSKNLEDEHDPGPSPYAIEVLKGHVNAVSYYNFANTKHLLRRELDENRDWYEAGVEAMGNRTMYRKNPDLAVDVNVRNFPSNYRLGLVQIAGYRYKSVQIFDWKNKIVPESEYEVYRVNANGQLYAKLSNDNYSGPFTYRIYYESTEPSHRSEPEWKEQGLVRQAMKTVESRLKTSGFSGLEFKLSKLAKNKKGLVGFSEISGAFHDSATYEFSNKVWPINNQADPVFKPYTRFLDNGQLRYQCTGSNRLLQAYIDEVAKNTGRGYPGSSVHTFPLVGWASDNRYGVLRGTPAHMHTLVVNGEISRSEQDLLELDATPSGWPDAERLAARKKKETKAEEESPLSQVLAKLKEKIGTMFESIKPAQKEKQTAEAKAKPQKTNIETKQESIQKDKRGENTQSASPEEDVKLPPPGPEWNDTQSASPEEDVKLPPPGPEWNDTQSASPEDVKLPPPGPEWNELPPTILPTQPKVVGGLQENENEETKPTRILRSLTDIEKIIARIRKMNDMAWRAVEPVAEQDPWLRRYPHLVDLPGVRVIILTDTLLKAFSESWSVEMTLARLQYPKNPQAQPQIVGDQAVKALDVFFADELDRLRQIFELLDNEVKNDINQPYQFIAFDPLRSRLRELTESVALYSWGDILKEYQTLKAPGMGVCEKMTAQ